MGILTTLKVRSAGQGRHGDGDGLYLLVKPTGARSWVLRVQRDGKRQDIGLGSVDLDTRERGEQRPSDEISILLKRNLTLAEARVKAKELRQFARAGRDPIVERDRDRSRAPTFSVAAQAVHDALKAGWTERTGGAFLKSLEMYAYPTIGKLRVDEIEASHIRDLLAPIWTTKSDTARKVRIRVGQVLNFSRSKGWRNVDAPIKSISIGLPKQPKGGNFRAMPYSDVPSFVQGLLDKAPTSGRRALIFMILTAARPGEVRLARWIQMDLVGGNWVRPAEIMKRRDAHTVTLSTAALRFLNEAKAMATTAEAADLLFPGQREKVLSDMSLSKVLRDANVEYDAHGFRSAFRDWAAERMPEIPDAAAEAALSHLVPDAVVRAYKRTDLIDLRRKLLESWGEFVCASPLENSLAESNAEVDAEIRDNRRFWR